MQEGVRRHGIPFSCLPFPKTGMTRQDDVLRNSGTPEHLKADGELLLFWQNKMMKMYTG